MDAENDSFLAAEKACEQTVEYNRYMMEMQLKEVDEDQTLLNDIEPPSMLCEQTLLRLTPGKPFNRPSTILEESTMATSECSFYTADLDETVQFDSIDGSDATLSENVEVIDLTDESSETRVPSDLAKALNFASIDEDTLTEEISVIGSSSGTIPKQPGVPTKVPQKGKKKKYDHIKSPVAAYIHNSPIIPTFTTNRLGADVRVVTNKSPRNVTTAGKENQGIPKVPKVTLPKKAYISAAFANVHDERVNPVVGGPKMMKLIGDQIDPEKGPTVTRHVYRYNFGYNTVRLPPDVVAKEREKMSLEEESIADLSVMSGDVSVQVVTNAIKY